MLAAIDIAQAVDYVFFAVLILAILAGSIRGASGELSRLLALVCGGAAVIMLSKFLQNSFGVSPMQAFAGAIFAGVIVVLIVNHITRKCIRIIIGQPADAIIGALMAVAGTLIVCALLLCATFLVGGEETGKMIFEDTFVGKNFSPVVQQIVKPIVEKLSE